MYIFIRHEDRKKTKTKTIKHHKENTIYDNAYAKAKLC